MHSSSSTFRTPSVFFQKAPADILNEIFLLVDNPPEELQKIDHNLKEVLNTPHFWRQRLQREFGFSREYCKLITRDKKNPAAALRIVYRRFLHLEERSALNDLRYYKNIIINGCVDFPPLLATGPAYPVIDAAKCAVYLFEAITLKNIRFVEHILLQLFPVVSEEKCPDHSRTGYVNRDSIDAVIEVNNFELLARMLPHANDQSDRNRIQFILEHSNIPSADQAIRFLHRVIDKQEGVLATYLLLQKKVMPNQDTLGLALSREICPNFIVKLLEMIPTHPQLLTFSEWDVFCKFVRILQKIDFDLMKSICKIIEKSSHTDAYIKEIQKYLLRRAVKEGDLPTIQSYEKLLKKESIIDLTTLAIQHGHLPILQHFIKQLDKKTILTKTDMRQAIRDCRHKNIIQYLMEEFKLFEPEDEGNGLSAGLRVLIDCEFNESWLTQLATDEHFDVLKYLINEAPTQRRLQPSGETLKQAARNGCITVAEYLIEHCKMIPTTEMITIVRPQYHDGMIYLLSQCLSQSDITPTRFPPSKFFKVMRQMDQPNEAVEKILDWMTGPEGKKRGFQLGLNNLTENIDEFDKLPMLAWLAAKLKIEVPLSARESIAKTLAKRATGVCWMRDLRLPVWEEICMAALNSVFSKVPNHEPAQEASMQCRR
jgi:hypothetical protein